MYDISIFGSTIVPGLGVLLLSSEYLSSLDFQISEITSWIVFLFSSSLIIDFRSVPFDAKRQVNIRPSAEILARVQSPQNGWDTDEMKPISKPFFPSIIHRLATSPLCVESIGIRFILFFR